LPKTSGEAAEGQTAESQKLEDVPRQELADVIDRQEEEDSYLRTRRVERRIEEVQAFTNIWERFGGMLKGCREGKEYADLDNVRQVIAQGYSKIMPRLDQPRTLGSRVVAAAKTGVTTQDIQCLSKEDFDRLGKHWQGGRALLTEYLTFLEDGRRQLIRENAFRYYWAKYMHNKVAAGITIAAGVLLACVIGVQVVKRLPKRERQETVETQRTADSTTKDTKGTAEGTTKYTEDLPAPQPRQAGTKGELGRPEATAKQSVHTTATPPSAFRLHLSTPSISRR